MLTHLSHQLILALTVGLAAFHQPDLLMTEFGVVALAVVVLDLAYGANSYRKGRAQTMEEKRPELPVS